MIGNKIQSCRKRAGLSQETLARELGISRQAVSRWETGEAIPDTEKVIQLSRLFQVSTDYLLLDEMEEAQGANFAPVKRDETREKRRGLRMFFGKLLLILGLLALTATLIGAGVYASVLTEWFTVWGRYGTALFRTWMLAPLILSACMLITGIVVLWMEYVRED